MKLLFIEMAPNSELEKIFLANGFFVQIAKRAGDFPNHDFDLVAYAPKTVVALKDISEIRAKYPQSWLAVAVRKNWLGNAAHVNELLKCDGFNEIWILELWQNTIWFSLKYLLQHKQMTSELISLRSQCHHLTSQSEELSTRTQALLSQLERDVILAGNVQRALLPKVSPQIPGVTLSVKYIAAPGAGGDYYDIFEFGDKKRFGILIADSKTHGIAAALLSVLVKVRLEEMKHRFPDSKSFVEFLNREIQQLHEREMLSLSLLYGILDRSSLVFQYTIAGSLKPILWRLGESPQLSLSTSPPLGGIDHFPFRENFLSLKPGDLLIFHTDGLEQPLNFRDENADAKLIEVLKAKDLSPDPLDLQNELMALVDRFVEARQLKDDITLIQLSIDERTLYLAS